MASDSRPRIALLSWVAAFVLHRAVILAFGFDGLFFWEEAYRTLVAEALRDGWNIPLHDLQADPYAGGSLVFSALAALAAPVFGTSLVALKGVALAWHAAGLWLWLLVADRVAGRPVAHALGFAWLAAPPLFVVFNLCGLGFHGDTLTLTGLQFLLLLRCLDEPRRGSRVVAWMAAGALGVWFAYASAVPLALGAAWALLAGLLPLRLWPVAALGFAAGFSPWIAYNLAAGGSTEIVAQTFAGAGGDAPSLLARLFDVTVRGVPAALYFRDVGPPGDVHLWRGFLAYPYLAIYAASFAAVAIPALAGVARSAAGAATSRTDAVRRAVAGRPELPILLLFPFFLVVLAASNQELNDLGVVPWFTFRVLVPALPSVLFAMAMALVRAQQPLRSIAFGVVAALALVGSGQLLADGSEARALREAEARQLGAEAMGHLLVFKHGTEPVVGERIEAIPAELRASAWRGVGFSVAYLYGTRRSAEAVSGLTDRLRAVEEQYREDSLEGARLAVGPGLSQVAPLLPSSRRDEIAAAIEAAGS